MLTAKLVALAAATALVFCRLGGFMVMSPFPSAWVPTQARVAMTVTLALVLGPSVAVDHPLDLDLLLALSAATEVTIGLLIGASFRFLLAAAEIMASMISQSSWLSVPMSFNPASGEQAQILAHVCSLFAMLVALGVGAHRVVLGYLLASFRAMPVGGEISIVSAIAPFVGLVGHSFEVGMLFALPVFAVSITVQAALALVARVAPSLQIFNVGFAVLVASGLVTFGASLGSIAGALAQYLETLASFLDQVLTHLGGG